MKISRSLRPAFACACLCVIAASAMAQSPARRDPTQPPAGYGAATASVRDPLDAFKPEYVVTVGAERYIVWQGRRYRVGDRVAGARLERIDETEIWLRTGGGVRKLALFPGIEKRPSAAVAASEERKK